jgi:hypothetical protein
VAAINTRLQEKLRNNMADYFGKKKYAAGVLRVLKDSVRPDFSVSSPSKIALTKGRAFSLPAGPKFACPGATEACKDCYAQKGRHYFSNVQKLMAANWNLMRKFERKNDPAGCALELCKVMPKSGIFRIHESGDFHSQFAVNVWGMVAQANPNVDFYSYTRSFGLNFTPFLSQDNAVMWASTDIFNKADAKRFVADHKRHGVKHAYGPWGHDDPIPKNSFICPVTNGKLAVDGACDKCQLCVLPNRTQKNVVFLIH